MSSFGACTVAVGRVQLKSELMGNVHMNSKVVRSDGLG
jgi:hypothetical protein